MEMPMGMEHGGISRIYCPYICERAHLSSYCLSARLASMRRKKEWKDSLLHLLVVF